MQNSHERNTLDRAFASSALAISDGASNPKGISRTLCDMLANNAPSAAVNLVLHQLVWVITRVDIQDDTQLWEEWRHQCREILAENEKTVHDNATL